MRPMRSTLCVHFRAVRRAGLLLAACLSLNACVSAPRPAPARPVHHVVLCWLKTPGDAAQRAKLIEASRGLGRIEAVGSVSAGTPVSSDRPVVDDSFDVAIHMTFPSVAALQAYEADPRHMMAVQNVLLPLTARIQVYDFIE